MAQNPYDQFDQSATGAVNDAAVSFAQGANGLLKAVGDIYGLTTGDMDNVVSRQAQENIEYLQRRKSPETVELEKIRKAATDAEVGVIDKAATYLKYTAPEWRLVFNDIAAAAPSMVGSGGAGAAVRGVAGRLGASAATAAKAGVGGAIAAGAGVTASQAGADQYAELVKTVKQMTPEQAAMVPQIVSRMEKGDTLDEAKDALLLSMARDTAVLAGLASAATMLVPGGTTVERALVGGPAATATRNVLGRVAGGAGGEMLQETAENVSAEAAKNIFARQVEPERELTRGMGEAIGSSVIPAAFMGAAGGASMRAEPAKPLSRPVQEGEPTAGIPVEPPAPVATREALTETPQIDLTKVENMTEDQFWSAVDARQTMQTGTELPGFQQEQLGEAKFGEKAIDPEAAKAATEGVNAVIEEWRKENPNSEVVEIATVFDPNMLHNGYGIRGAYNRDSKAVLLNAAFLQDPETVKQVLNHEWAHHTLDTEEGRAALQDFARRSLPEGELEKLSERYGTDDPLVLVDEWIAQNQEKAPGVLARMVNFVREWLAKVGIVNLSHDEVARILLRTLRQEASGRVDPVTEREPAPTPETEERFSLAKEPERISGIMASPSITDIQYNRAKRNLTSANQARFKSQIADYAPDADIFDAVGDWVDGAENSVAVIFRDRKPVEELQRLAAQAGLAGDQKAVLWWSTNPEGADAIHEIVWPKGVSIDDARQAMIDVGLENRTLIQTPDGIRGFVFDQGRQNLNKIEALHEHETQPSLDSSPASGDFLGSWSSRAEGRRAYRRVLGSTPQTETGAGELRSEQVGTGNEPETRFSLAQTETPEFKEWNKGNKVVDDQGKPLPVYHGTNQTFTIFGDNSQRFDVGWFTDSPEEASMYAKVRAKIRGEGPGVGEQVYKSYVSMKNPMVVDAKGRSFYAIRRPGKLLSSNTTDLAAEAYKMGHDGLIVENVYDSDREMIGEKGDKPITVYVVFDPKQVKSATGNVGAFGQRPVTAEEASRLGMTEAEAAEAQERGDMRFALTQDQIDAVDGKRVDELDIPELVKTGVLTDRYSSLLQSLRETAGEGNTVIEVVSPEDFPRKAAGLYNPNTDVIQVSSGTNVDLGRILLHEYTHALTVIGLKYADEITTSRGDVLSAEPRPGVSGRELRAASRKMDDLFDTAQKAASEAGEKFYGLTSREEFVAEAFSNKRFQQFLSSIPATGAGSKQSLFDKFVSIVKQILGVGDEDESLLTEVISATQPLVRAQKKISSTLMAEDALPEETKTPQFKNWFGDWESRPEEASKVVDEQGNPLVVKHGTKEDFNVFDMNRKGNPFRPASGGAWFAEGDEIPKKFSGDKGRVVEAYLNVRKPFELPKELDLNNDTTPSKFEAAVNGILGTDGENRVSARELNLPDRANYTFGVWQLVGYNGKLVEALKKRGYDGIKAYEDGITTWKVFEPTQIKSATGNTGEFDPTNPDIRHSLTEKPVGQTALEDSESIKFKNQRETAKYLGDLLKKEFPEGLDRMDSETADKLANLLDRELSLALTMPENADAIGWYGREMEKVVEILRSPELNYQLDDPVNRGLFNAILAITSNGQEVVDQFLKSAQLYEGWRKTGKIPPIGKWGGERNIAMKGQLKFLNQMMNLVGPEATVGFLTSENSLRDHLDNLYGMVAEAQGLPEKATVKAKEEALGKYLNAGMPSGELKDYNTVGAIVFGPKLGGGFFANLYGKFDRLTMDRWFMRTFHRLTGRLGLVEEAPIQGALDEARNELGAAEYLTRAAAGIKPGSYEPVSKERLSDEDLMAYIKTEGKKAFKDYKEIKAGLKENPEDASLLLRDTLRRTYNRIIKAESGLFDAPDNGGHRVYIRDVINRLQKLRDQRGDDHIDTSDIQAILWYLEKDIWNRLKDQKAKVEEDTDVQDDEDKDDSAGRVSYSNGALELYRRKTGKDYVFKNADQQQRPRVLAKE